jgi:cytochrome b6-f complex iron-sulfur subunit
MSDLKPGPEKIPRRSVIFWGGQWLTALVVGVALYPLSRFISFKLPRKPVRIRVDKNLAVGGFHISKDFILFLDEHGPWAVSRKCTHLGCSVSYNENEKKLICPCHQSSFSIKGTRLAGPAKRNLKTYTVEPLPEDQRGFIVVI